MRGRSGEREVDATGKRPCESHTPSDSSHPRGGRGTGSVPDRDLDAGAGSAAAD